MLPSGSAVAVGVRRQRAPRYPKKVAGDQAGPARRAEGVETGRAARQAAIFSSISEHADGERRGPVTIRRDLETRLIESFQMLPSDRL